MNNITKGPVWIIMPVYNEEEAVPGVIKEWSEMLATTGVDYTFLMLNDGSKDATLQKLNESKNIYPNIQIVDKANSGHGQSCITGYEMAVAQGAEWIFQIDSDGQCDPRFFKDMLAQTGSSKAIFGYRSTRDDGFQRFLISRVVSMFTYVATHVWVKDANVPYRMIHKEVMQKILSKVPRDFHLANIFVSVLVQKNTPIKWVDIHFRDRAGGSPSVKTFSFAKHGMKLYRQLKAAVKNN